MQLIFMLLLGELWFVRPYRLVMHQNLLRPEDLSIVYRPSS
jgi:hypothetical protein